MSFCLAMPPQRRYGHTVDAIAKKKRITFLALNQKSQIIRKEY